MDAENAGMQFATCIWIQCVVAKIYKYESVVLVFTVP